jgi:hypothetical protein
MEVSTRHGSPGPSLTRCVSHLGAPRIHGQPEDVRRCHPYAAIGTGQNPSARRLRSRAAASRAAAGAPRLFRPLAHARPLACSRGDESHRGPSPGHGSRSGTTTSKRVKFGACLRARWVRPGHESARPRGCRLHRRSAPQRRSLRPHPRRAADGMRGDAASPRPASLAWADGQNLGRAGDLVENRPSDRTRVVFIPGRVQPNLNRLWMCARHDRRPSDRPSPPRRAAK